MDATNWMEREYAHSHHERSGTFLRQDQAPISLSPAVSVMVLYADPIIAAGLAAVLHERTGFQVVSTAELGDPVCGSCPVDVVLTDYETALRLAASAPQWAKNLLVFTNYESEGKICRALESGARGYLLHGSSLPELFEGIHSIHGGGVALSPPVAARITNRIQGEPLTAREKTVLGQLMLGLSNKVIARRLNLRVGTVKSHVKSILAKLHADTRTAAVVTAQRRGLLP